MKGRFRVIGKLRDEDKWLGLTKKQLVYALIAVFLIINIVKFTYKVNLIFFGGFFSTAIGIAAFLLCKYEVDKKKYLKGGGYGIDVILVRMIVRKLPGNRVLYVKGLEKGGISQ